MKSLTTFVVCIMVSIQTTAQNNCGNPLQVNICPGVTLFNQTNAGMGDDIAGPSCNIVGEDVLYQVNISNGAIQGFCRKGLWIVYAFGKYLFYIAGMRSKC